MSSELSSTVQDNKVRIRTLPSGKYLEKKVEQELKELIEIQNNVIKQIEKMLSKLESL